jgi:hypothetical protein
VIKAKLADGTAVKIGVEIYDAPNGDVVTRIEFDGKISELTVESALVCRSPFHLKNERRVWLKSLGFDPFSVVWPDVGDMEVTA